MKSENSLLKLLVDLVESQTLHKLQTINNIRSKVLEKFTVLHPFLVILTLLPFYVLAEANMANLSSTSMEDLETTLGSLDLSEALFSPAVDILFGKHTYSLVSRRYHILEDGGLWSCYHITRWS